MSIGKPLEKSVDMTYRFRIDGRLPGMNEFIEKQRTNRYVGAKLKREAQDVVAHYIQKHLPKVKIKKPVYITYHWYELNKRRDLDNIAGFGHKVIQDAMVECGLIKNDGWNEITGFRDYFYVDKQFPRIDVELREV